MDIHHLEVVRTARYATLGPPAADAREIWFVCHGYSQLATTFLAYFGSIDDGSRLIVAPEGLSRFYAEGDGGGRRIGASWMTREDRDQEIDDYVRYLDALGDRIIGAAPPGVPVTALGFSQGVATVSRWTARGAHRIDRLVLWGELLPPEFDSPEAVSSLRERRIVVVHGRNDKYIAEETAAQHRERLDALGLSYDYLEFDGGHRLNRTTLEQIAAAPPLETQTGR